VDGSTRLLGVVGHPIAQVRAPRVWTALFQHNGINAVCIPLHVEPANLQTAFAGLRALRNLAGLVVTIPHKPVIGALLDDLTSRARQTGVVNSIATDAQGRTLGDTFDGVGFVAGLRAAGKEVRGLRGLVVGSGGVGSAIAFALAEAGVRALTVTDLDSTRAAGLARRLGDAGFDAEPGTNDARGYDLVVNATPMGMRPDDPLPFDPAQLDARTLVGDVIISAELTPLLAAARARGCFVQPGSVMTDRMIVHMAEFFAFPRDADWSAETIARLV
jgi:shikimate 5-dehydrogenase